MLSVAQASLSINGTQIREQSRFRGTKKPKANAVGLMKYCQCILELNTALSKSQALDINTRLDGITTIVGLCANNIRDDYLGGTNH